MVLGDDFKNRSLCTGDRTLEGEDADFRINRHHAQTAHADTLLTVATRTAQTAQRVLGEPLTDGADVPFDVLVTVGTGCTVESVALHRTGEALSFGETGHTYHVAGSKD